MFTPDQVKALEAPLNAEHVKTRSQAGRSLSYIEGWQAIKEANRIFGFDAWDRETVELRQLGKAYQDQKSLWRVAYFAKVRIKVRTAGAVPPTLNEIIREGCGYGSGIDRDLGSAHESALKEAETDAMKRALMTFGNPFGLALYDKQQAEVERSRSSDGSEHRASNARVAGSSPAETAKPKKTIRELVADWSREIMDSADPNAWQAAHAEELAKMKTAAPRVHLEIMNLLAEREQQLEAA